jgi:hypothetical protein
MFLFIPFDFKGGNLLWSVVTTAAVLMCAFLAMRNYLFALIAALSPPTLFMLGLGQDASLVALACTILLLEVSDKKRAWIIIPCLFVASIKVSTAALPVLVASYFLLRDRQYRTLLWTGVIFSLLLVIYTVVYPGIIPQWIGSIFSGNYFENARHIPLAMTYVFRNGWKVAFGLSWYSNAPLFISIPVLVWFLWNLRKGLTRGNIALALSMGFLFLPYWRLYDLVMLVYPAGVLIDWIIRFWRNSVAARNNELLSSRE